MLAHAHHMLTGRQTNYLGGAGMHGNPMTMNAMNSNRNGVHGHTVHQHGLTTNDQMVNLTASALMQMQQSMTPNPSALMRGYGNGNGNDS